MARDVRTWIVLATIAVVLIGVAIAFPRPREQPSAPGLPPPCTEAQVEVDGRCFPARCGTARWGRGEIATTTTYVDASAELPGDGTASAPWTTIQQGLDSVQQAGGGTIHLAAGTYRENLLLSAVHRDIHIVGRCPELVVLDGGDVPDQPAVSIAGARGIRLSGLAVGRAGDGGIRVGPRSSLVLDEVDLAGNHDVGLMAQGPDTDVAMDRVVIRDTEAARGREGGHGLLLFDGARLEARESHLVNNRWTGIGAEGPGTQARLERVVIRDTRARNHDDHAISLYLTRGASAAIRHCLVQDNEGEGTVVKTGSTLTADHTAWIHNAETGVRVLHPGSSATITRSSVERTRPIRGRAWCAGFQVGIGGSLEATATRIAGNVEVGGLVHDPDSKLALDRCAIEDTRPDHRGRWGMGLHVADGGRLDARRTVVRGNAHAGIAFWGQGTTGALDAVSILDTAAAEKGPADADLVVTDGAAVRVDGELRSVTHAARDLKEYSYFRHPREE